MTVKNVFKNIAEFNVVVTIVIAIIFAFLVKNTDASVIKFCLSVIGLVINIMKKRTLDKSDKEAHDNINWMITGFACGVFYCTFCLFC
jgi:Na+/H+ antiporter NhaD/arsenite permease-like protein